MGKITADNILLGLLCEGFPEGILILLGAIIFLSAGPFLLSYLVLKWSVLVSVILNVLYLILLTALIVFIIIKRKAAKKRKIQEKLEEQRWLERGGYVKGPENPKEEELDPEVEAYMRYREERDKEYIAEGGREGIPTMAPPIPETPEEYYAKRWRDV